jgi:non-ribosomal peptide synthetase component F
MTRCFVIGGENLRAENLTLWRNFAPATRLINEYGPTETVVGCCVHEVGPDDPPDGSIPIGRPIANTQLYVLGADLEPVPPARSASSTSAAPASRAVTSTGPS